MAQPTISSGLTLFRDRFRTTSLRKSGRDYAGPGNYFVTICTKDRFCWFGEIRQNMMGLNEIGCIVAAEIQRTADIRPGIIIDKWIVMPNHIKASSTKHIRQLGHATFAWQPRYYDRIIDNEDALYAARHYIVMNPSRWQYDRNYQI